LQVLPWLAESACCAAASAANGRFSGRAIWLRRADKPILRRGILRHGVHSIDNVRFMFL
jgi:hypothetical protein